MLAALLTRLRRAFPLLVLTVAVALVAAGLAWWVHPGAGLIVAGLALGYGALFLLDDGTKPDEGDR